LAFDGQAPSLVGEDRTGDLAAERGVPALFSWGDLDGDGRLDLAAVTAAGELQVLRSTPDGRFEDVTERLGLADIGEAVLALWADYDGDGRPDLFVGAREGASRLFHNEGGLFVDMSAGAGLASEGAVQSAQWLDHDGDGRLDLFLATAEKGELVMRLFRGLEGGFFEVTELPLAGTLSAPGLGGPLVATDGEDAGGSGAPPSQGSSGERGGSRTGRWSGGDASVGVANASGGRIARTPSPSGSSGASLPMLASCLLSLRDQANPNTCLQASTSPTLGKLYPITANLFVAVGGNVGVGTTSPTAKLHVAGTARMTDTLTLNPSGDTALDVSTGSIYKGGALFLHTKGGVNNTALGKDALASVTTGFRNTASGNRALFSNTIGVGNVASGYKALYTYGDNNTADGTIALAFNTSGSSNSAFGVAALRSNTSGSDNVAVGSGALAYNTTGLDNAALGSAALGYNTVGNSNSALGLGALYNNTTGSSNTAVGASALVYGTTGSRNIAIGASAGSNLTTGSDNVSIANTGVAGEASTIRIGTPGTHTRAFVAGIRGVTTGLANAVTVLVDSSGQLGTVSSSRRFKEDIRDMNEATARLLELRPVRFRYKQEQTLPGGQEVPPEYGLIAEEVAEVFPDLVVYDEDGQPFTVKYHLLSSMLLNELKKLDERSVAESAEQAHAMAELAELRSEVARLRGLEARLAAVEAGKKAQHETPAEDR